MRAFDTKAVWVGVAAAIFVIAASGCSATFQTGPLTNTPLPATAAVVPGASAAAPATSAPAETPQSPVPAITAPSTTAVAPTPTVEMPTSSSAITPTVTMEMAASATAVTPTATMEMAPATTPAAAGQSSAQAGVQYKDDFTDPNSGWPNNVQFGNYFIGYHEPNHYHVDVHAPHDRAIQTIPKRTFTDFTMEVKVMADPNNTAKTGDFRYGLVFRRAGNQFYAFVVSPRTKDWQVLKSAPDGVTVLTKGANAPTQGLTADDTLRIDAKGNTFFFSINGQLLGTASDNTYTTGEAGFYVETFDSPRIHAHWGTIIVRDVELPQLVCIVLASGLNVRNGPGVDVYPIIDGVRRGAQLVPLGRDATGTWMKVQVVGRGTVGWVFAFPALVSCNLPTNALAVAAP